MFRYEGFTEAKDPTRPETCEDRLILVPGRLCAVVDGATDITGRRYDDIYGKGATGGYLAAQAVADTLGQMAVAARDTLPDADEVMAALDLAIRGVYRRLGVEDEALSSGDNRFRAGVSAAFIAGGKMRLMALGDCPVRLNGAPVLHYEFPGDVILSQVRVRAWGLLASRAVPVEVLRASARDVIVEGLGAGARIPEGLTRADMDAIRAELLSDPACLQLCGGDPAGVDLFLTAGLAGIRRDPAAYRAAALDGTGNGLDQRRVLDIDLADIDSLEIASDGYPAPGAAPALAAWEARLAEVDALDPDRIREFPSTKGRTPKTFGDDRTLLILTPLRAGKGAAAHG